MTNPMIQAMAAAGVTGELQNVKVGGALRVRPEPYRVDLSAAQLAIQNIYSYKIGDGRENLLAIEEMVRQSQYNEDDRKGMAALLAKVVDSQASKDAKAFACRQLWIIATPAEVSTLGKALIDPALSDMARYALQNMDCADVDTALIAALDGTPASVQIGCINSLAMRKSPGAADAIKPLKKSKDEGVEAAAKHALARLDGKLV